MRIGIFSAACVAGALALGGAGCGGDELYPGGGRLGSAGPSAGAADRDASAGSSGDSDSGALVAGGGGSDPIGGSGGSDPDATAAGDGGEAGTVVVQIDTDGDGLTDDQEELLGTNPNRADTDGDGLSDREEIEGRTSATSADTDGDGLDDGEEAESGTDPNRGDTDEDGLSDGEEHALGSNPNASDTDGDGWTDAEELAASSDPLRPYAWDYAGGGWPDFSAVAAAAGVNGTSYGMGETLPDFTVFDQFGRPLSLYQFYGYVVLITVSTGWCEHCRTEAPELQALWEDLRGQGLIVMQLLADDAVVTGYADVVFRKNWADAYGLEYPVIGEGDTPVLLDGLYYAGIFERTYPLFFLLDRQMRIDWGCIGVLYCDYEARIRELLD